MKFKYLLFLFFSLAFSACETISLSLATPDLQTTLQPTGTVPLATSDNQISASTPTQTGPIQLRIWVPPQFDPGGNSSAAEMFQSRLDEFSDQHDGVQLEVRIKSETGTAGLLGSLSATSAAAPLALPDLIALPSQDLEAAALKGLLNPVDQLDEIMVDPDWYDYARLSVKIQDRVYGLPFAGDALALVYRAEKQPTPPSDWSSILNTTLPLVFPASDPQALFTLSQYLAKGGSVRDDEGRPVLDTESLTDVLIFFQEAGKSGIMPSWLTQFEQDQQIWQTYNEAGADVIITWSSNFLQDKPRGTTIAALPTNDGQPYTLSRGWVWAIPAHQPEHQELSLELAKLLTESNYLGKWTESAGMLPPRASAFEEWSESEFEPVVEIILRSAQMLPSPDVLTSLGQVLSTATEQILLGESNPDSAARQAVESLTGP